MSDIVRLEGPERAVYLFDTTSATGSRWVACAAT